MTVRRVVVKADNPDKWLFSRSRLSNLDLLMPPFHVWSTLFYDYRINPERLEKALGKALTRYGELAGRLVLPKGLNQPVVEMNNFGCLLAYFPESPLTINDLKEKQFENDFVYDNFCDEDLDDDENEDESKSGIDVKRPSDNSEGDNDFLLKVRMRPLYENGMVISLGFHYQVCDVNSMYIFTADMCSLIRRGIFAFKESQIQTCQRCETFKPNSAPILEHPEYEIARTEDTQRKWEVLINDVAENPRINVRFMITQEKLSELKAEVCIKHPNEVPVSSNDCIASIFWKACVKGMKIENSDISTFQLACNGRFRRKPPLPRTYFGNAMFIVHTCMHKDKLLNDSAYRTACRIRKSVLKINDQYMQSVINYVEKEGVDNVQFSSGHQLLDFSITNWNQYFDWYRDGDLGRGKPVKFLVASKHLAGMVIVLPSEPNGMEVLTGLTKEQFQIVLQDHFISKYFTWC